MRTFRTVTVAILTATGFMWPVRGHGQTASALPAIHVESASDSPGQGVHGIPRKAEWINLDDLAGRGLRSDRKVPPLFPTRLDTMQGKRPFPWKYPLIGLGAGVIAGGILGLAYDLNCGGDDNWFCGTYTVSYAVIGGAAGGLIGLIAGAKQP